MIAIPGYRITEQLYLGSRTQVYRGISESEQKPVVIKLLLNEYPNFNELIQFRNQYTIAKNLDLPGVVKHLSLEQYGNGFAVVMEDNGSISLAEYIRALNASSLPLEQFFPIAIQIVQTLEELYHNRVIHKDIKPQNILINPQTKQVKLIDFSISSLLPRENQEIANPNVLEGTLAYISPEQTGRMNRGIDYRTDFYSLGVTFYELLTGQLPFMSADPMELVHCHLARKPTPPSQLNPGIPQMVSDIVMKLMSKTAEERYQSAFGLRVDLETCWQQWQAEGSISQFLLGRRDITERFMIPEKLYGRETEVATLLGSFERVSTGSIEMMLVTGFSGIGKTAVVNEVHKPIVRQRGYFIKGKFDQFKRDIPFSAWVQALQNLMRQLLGESASAVQKWKALMLEALGENGQVIIDVIPELELLIGAQPEVPELDGSAALNRFNFLFEKFIRVFATIEHPLVIFLDDLQWADGASLKLMQLLMSQTDTGYLLLIGAYRDNEVFPAHPLMLTLDEIRKGDVTVNQITLAPLDQPSVNRLIADTLSCPPPTAIPLTELVVSKTKGNPFFATQFLKSLHQDGLISFDFSGGYWQCDIARLRALAVSDDIVEFMATQLEKLPNNTQEVLKLAACVGNSFDLATLAIVHEKSQAETAADLWRALQEGVVIPITESYKFFQDESAVSSQDSEQLTVPYRFLHDRVQQAAYSLIPEDQKQSTHLKIGQLLLTNTPLEKREEKIFDIVNQLNSGRELINERAERDELAQLNLIAGRKAKASTAYAAAKRYLTVGLELLAADSWLHQYELTLALYESGAEIAYLNADYEQMERLVEIVMQRGKTVLDQVKVYEVKIKSRIAQSQQLEAVKIGLQVLELMGVSLPESPTPLDIQQALSQTKALLNGKSMDDLLNLPLTKEPDKLATMQILKCISSPTYLAAPALFPLIGLLHVNLSTKYGNSIFSPYGYVIYGLILNGIVLDIDSAYKFGQLGLNLGEKLNALEFKAEILSLVGTFTVHGKVHARETLPLLLESYQSGLENGQLEYGGYSAVKRCEHSYFIGQELTELEREIAKTSNALAQLKQETPLSWNRIFHQAVLTLLNPSNNPCYLLDEASNQEKLLSILREANDRTGLHYFYEQKLILCYLFGEYPKALENATQGQQYLDGVRGVLAVPVFHFYDSLARLAVYTDAATPEQEDILNQVRANQEKMQKWAHHAPMNHLHKFDLVEAELYRILGQYMEAMDYYDKAIAGAKAHEYINEEALAHELAAKFYLEWGKQTIAQAYLTNAYYAYARWGAKAKLEHLEQRYPQILAPILTQRINATTGETILQTIAGTISSTSTGKASEFLDFTTVIKASQSLSGEVELDKLLSSLMQVAIENAGAEKGILILSKAGNLVIEATKVSGTTEATVLQSIPVEQSQEIPVTLINYVYRTFETLVLDDASVENTFSVDPYIIGTQPKSVLCTPIVNQGKLIGILYLENNLTPKAFTPDRLEVLKILSAQAAISITNAKLYAEVKESQSQLTQFLNAMPIGVSVHEPNGQLYYANQTAQELMGINALPQAETQQLSQAYHVYRAGTNQLYPTEQLPIVRSLHGERVNADDLDLHQPDKIIPVEISTTPILDETGKIVYALAAFQDITERKKAETERIRFTNELFQLNKAYERFVPNQFLQFLGKSSIIDVELGDQLQLEMSVLFSDIRDFTTLSESMNPEDNFRFINSYLSRMETVINKNNGFIDKYIGDAIMALFSGEADNAVKAGIAMLHCLGEYNQHRTHSGDAPIQIGIGINTGTLMLGTVGGQNRMEGTVISDAVNLASRVESLTKNYEVSLLITEQTYSKLTKSADYGIRTLDTVKVKGKSQFVTVMEVFDADPPEIKEGKLTTLPTFSEALSLYNQGKLAQAGQLFADCLRQNSGDRVAKIYLDRCEQY